MAEAIETDSSLSHSLDRFATSRLSGDRTFEIMSSCSYANRYRGYIDKITGYFESLFAAREAKRQFEPAFKMEVRDLYPVAPSYYTTQSSGKMIPLFFLRENDEEKISIVPTHPYYFNDINPDIQLLFGELKQLKGPRNGPKKHFSDEEQLSILEKIAKIHYLLACSAQFDRGSAGIADCYSKTLLDWFGFQVSRFKPGVLPDLEAFSTPMTEFIRNYTSDDENGLFVRKPFIPS